jgi:alanine dehydrogenase
MNIGIIKEGKIPHDRRVPLTPDHCKEITEDYIDIEVFIEHSDIRSYADDEYLEAGVPLVSDLHHCDVLLGVKEVPIRQLLPRKVYFFFSHTIKEQAYNQDLIKAILDKKIHLIDYEVLTDEEGNRLIAFGRFAGMVGAHNALWTYGQRSNAFTLPRMHECKDYAEAKVFYKNVQWPSLKIVLTGTGRVGDGAAKVLTDMNIKKVSPHDFLDNDFEGPVFTQLDCQHYVQHRDGQTFRKEHFFEYPEEYESIFYPFAQKADIFINGIYWDPDAPQFFSKEEMKKEDFAISVIADITCDIAPESSIPSTLRPSTIAEPVYGYHTEKEKEISPYQEEGIDIMAIDNLPNELPRDASQAFGDQFMQHIFPELLKFEESEILERATIAKNGELGPNFEYLKEYAGLKA